MISGATVLNDAVRQAHAAHVNVTVHPASGPSWTAAVASGTYSQDRTSQVRTSARITVAAAEVIGGQPDVRPFGDRITIRRGILAPDGKSFVVQLGVFRVDAVSWQKPGTSVEIEASSLMAQVVDEKFTQPRTIPRSADPRGMAIQLVNEAFAGITQFAPSDVNAAGSVYDRERIDAVTDLAASIGCEARFTNLGVLSIDPTPDGTAAPVWTVDGGDEGVMVEFSSGYDRALSYNAVVAEGRSSYGRPIRFVAKNEDPADPMRWGGPFGRVPMFYSSDLLTTPSRCQAAAEARLADGKGKANAVTISCVPHPGLEVGDVIEVLLPAHTPMKVLCDQIELPLAEGDMSITGRIVDGVL